MMMVWRTGVSSILDCGFWIEMLKIRSRLIIQMWESCRGGIPTDLLSRDQSHLM
jgi:hypothetical protein